jgi:8-amino-7-oxononanoate synthase
VAGVTPALSGMALDDLLTAVLLDQDARGQLRRRVANEVSAPARLIVEGREYLNFASNDYLGLSCHSRLIAAATAAMRLCGMGAGASPLISGHTEFHAAAEAALAKWKKTESAVLLPSGYQTSHAIIQTFVALPDVRFLLDKLAHASLVDAIQASGRAYRVFPHNNLSKLHRLLTEATPGQLQVVVTESIYSMDGDAAPLHELADLKRRLTFAWILDEAHGSGVYGAGGAGLAEEMGVWHSVDVYLVTLSKALGMAGGAICASQRFCEAVVNFGRACVYSTAVSPAIAGAVPEAIAVMADEPWRQQRVRVLARRVRSELAAMGVKMPPGDSPIIPLILGDENLALAAAEALRERGLWVQAIRPPTVPRGRSRLRVTLSSEHTDEDVGRLMEGVRLLLRLNRPDLDIAE